MSERPENVLVTERIRLRRLNPADAPLLHELDSDPEVMRHISKSVPTPFEKILSEVLPRMLSWDRESPPQGFWPAHLLAGGEFIGWFHLRPEKISAGEMELGYRLKREYWGRGLATEGTRALIAAAFRDWGYPKLSARTLVGNHASRRVMEKAGLRFEGHFYWSQEALPGWTEEERQGVKYGLSAGEYQQVSGEVTVV